MLKIIVLSLSCAGCASMMASEYKDAREDCRARYESNSEERQECLEEATEVYRQKSRNLRTVVESTRDPDVVVVNPR